MQVQQDAGGKARGSAAKRSHTANNIADAAQRRSTAVQKKKLLPANFAENVLEYELSIDQGKFTIDTINELLLLYSQAVEYYNCINDDKYNVYQERIQNMLVRPEILSVMQNASKDPAAAKREEENRK